MNAVDDIRIRAGREVTDAEAAGVVEWCADWYRDCAHSFAEIEYYAMQPGDIPTLASLLRACDRHIVGGIAFVLADVRACAA